MPNDSPEQPNLSSVSLMPIAYIRSCYPERFGIPRQAGLVSSATATIVFPNTDLHWHSLRGITDFSHLWVIFLFHGQSFSKFKPLVRPPRLGGNKTVGVYASRSPNRPNQIGLSAVPLDQIEQTPKEILLHIHGGDFLDGTPVLDIKPYVRYADAIATASSTWADDADPLLPIEWSPLALANLESSTHRPIEDIQRIIADVIAQDPRPGYERGKDGQPGQEWNMRLAGFDIFWKVEAGNAVVTRLSSIVDQAEGEGIT